MIYQLLNIYSYLLIARVILSWFINPYQFQSNPIGYWLCLLTDPFLRIFRRLPFATIGGMIDISPIFAFLSIDLLKRFLLSLTANRNLSIGQNFILMILNLLSGLSNLISMIFFLLSILLALRLLYLWFSSKTYHPILAHIDYSVRQIYRKQLHFLGLSGSALQLQVLTLFILSAGISYLFLQLAVLLR